MLFKRFFVALKPDDGGYFIDGERPDGFFKVERSGNRGRITINVSGLKPPEDFAYKGAIIGFKDGEPAFVEMGILKVDDYGRSLSQWFFDPEDIDGRGLTLDDISIFAIFVDRLDNEFISPMVGVLKEEYKVWKNVVKKIFAVKGKKKVPSSTEDKAKKPTDEIKLDDLSKKDDIEKGEAEKESELEKNEADKVVKSEGTIEAKIDEDIKPTEEKIPAEEENLQQPEWIVGSQKDLQKDISDKGDGIQKDDTYGGESKEETEQLDKDVNQGLTESGSNDNKGNVETLEFRNETIYGETEYIKNLKSYITGLVSHLEQVQPFDDQLDNYKWWKVPTKDNTHEDYYLMGLCYEGGKVKYIAYAMKGKFSIMDQPYGGLTGFVCWLPVKGQKMGYDADGYWIMHIDAVTGQIAIPLKPTPPPMFSDYEK